ncbi:MAG: hypothetical protein M3497_10205 [Gemmatimonadota bacterium]|nr:hypothetical protein [Gemmatimonadota bacterium]
MRSLVVRVQPFATAILYRSVAAWLGVRIFVAVAIALLGLVPPPHPVLLSPGAALTVVLVVAVLGLVDAHRRNEDLFLANLGVSRSRIVVTAAIPALVLELVVLVGGQL